MQNMFDCFQNGPWISQAVKLGDHPNRVISKHQSSSRHLSAVATGKNTSKRSLPESLIEGAEIISDKNKEVNRKLLTKYIKIVYFMIKKQWAVTENFASLVKFIGQDLGDSDIQSYLSSCGKNATYLSNISVDNIVGAISIYLEQITILNLKVVESFALLADESTDESQREQLGLIASYKLKGVPKVTEAYLGLINLASTNAESITSAIEKFMIVKGINIANCFFIALDGANVMSGEISGVQRRVRHLSPHSMYINCRNHRLALIFAHLLKKHVILQDVDSLLVSLWKLFHFSPTKQQVFKDIQSNVYCISILKTLKVSVTRWLSHGLACERVVSRYQQLVETLDTMFQTKREPELRGLREQLLNDDVLLCLLFLSDFLKIINKLSLWLQNTSILFGSVKAKVFIIIKEVEEFSVNLKDAENFQKAEELLKYSEECTEFSMKTRCKISNQNISDKIQNFIQNFVKKFLSDFMLEISEAFAINNDILTAFDMFSNLDLNYKLPNSPDKTCLSALLSFYGNKQTDKFQGSIKISPPFINSIEAKEEIDGFETEMSLAKVTYDMNKNAAAQSLLKCNKKEKAKKCIEKNISSLDALNSFEKESHCWETFPNLLKLLTLSVIIPTSTATVERLFSKMNLVCTELRTRMKQETLDRHLRIILNGPEKLTDSECSAILDIFKSTGNRRISL